MIWGEKSSQFCRNPECSSWNDHTCLISAIPKLDCTPRVTSPDNHEKRPMLCHDPRSFWRAAHWRKLQNHSETSLGEAKRHVQRWTPCSSKCRKRDEEGRRLAGTADHPYSPCSVWLDFGEPPPAYPHPHSLALGPRASGGGRRRRAPPRAPGAPPPGQLSPRLARPRPPREQ